MSRRRARTPGGANPRPKKQRSTNSDIRLLQALQDMGAGRRRRVARRVVGALAARQAGDLGVEIGVEEERDRVALAIGRADHAVLGRGEAVVGPFLLNVAAVTEIGARSGLGLTPFAGEFLMLSPA